MVINKWAEFINKYIFSFKIGYLYLCLLNFFTFYFTNFEIVSVCVDFFRPLLPWIGIVVLLVDNKDFKNYKIILLITFFYLFANTNYNVINDIGIELLLCIMFISECPKEIGKYVFYYLVLWLIASILGSITGLLPFTYRILGNRHHYIFNFAHHNKIGLYIFGILALYYYLIKQQVFRNIYLYLILCIVAISYTFLLCDSRTATLVDLMLITAVIFDQWIIPKYHWLENFFFMLMKYLWILPIATLGISMVLAVTYNADSFIWQFANKLLSGRLELQHNFYLNYGFPLFGSGIQFCGYECDVYAYVDNGFLRYIYENGLIFITVLLTVFSVQLHRIFSKKGNIYLFFITLIFCFVGLSEWISFIYCPFIYMLFCDCDGKESRYL